MKKILIANRSEIALRLQATCHTQGIATVAIYSPEDKFASYVYNATEAYALSGSGYTAYLNADEIIEIATKANVDAILPGYGFLSENASFAQKVINAGLLWIGPQPNILSLMANKITARTTLQQSGIPVVPGFVINNTEHLDTARHQATALGFPLIIKDPTSGGGKAVRKVHSEQDFLQAITTVLSESSRLTGNTTILVEKYIQDARHIEIQVAGDGQNAIHLFERDCSLQRRHQKIIEESQCLFVPPAILNTIYQTALRVVQITAYNSIGTVEFLVTPTNDFYFLEMNPRLQVEHTVTEMITGIDLVAVQLHIAVHKQLPLKQTDVISHGHAIECRLYAEDPANNFLPSTGIINHVWIPQQPNIRVESDLKKGTEITALFDPMIAKFISWAPTRRTCCLQLASFLQQCVIHGIVTNKEFLHQLLTSEMFTNGTFHIQSIANKEVVPQPKNEPPSNHQEIIAGLAALLFEQGQQLHQSQKPANTVRRWKDQQWQ